ncbi:MAG: indole-3-glycerol phosphate synthase TrpC [Terriglobales bacterium]
MQPQLAPSASRPASPPAGLASILDQIVSRRKLAVAAAERQLSVRRMARELRLNPEPRREFVAALRLSRRPAVIAELKRASPSRGRLREDFDVPALAAAYERAGAAALSVLTEPHWFEGKLEYLAQARQATRLPILRKDFIFSNYQVWESAHAGADAILLIAAMLDDAQLEQLVLTARRANLAVLCEVHTEQELRRASRFGADCLGVNSRDLHSFEVDLGVAERLGPLIPGSRVGVAESGLRSAADLARMSAAGYTAFLVGESFMRQPDPGAALEQLLGDCQVPFVKICGLTNLDDARHACAVGANAVGFVFAPSPRRVSGEQVRAIAPMLPAEVLRVGVFAEVPLAEVQALAQACGLHAVQLHGNYDPAAARRLSSAVPVWRALAMPAEAEAAAPWTPFVERFVLDGGSGGSGQSFDWTAAQTFIRGLPANAVGAGATLLAGGLNAANVAAALRACGACGADVSSGVELRPGHKSPLAVSAFCRAARSAFWGASAQDAAQGAAE